MKIEPNTFICADCMEILPGLPDGFADAIITDPPYEAEAHTLQRRVKRGSHSAGIDDREAKNQPLSFEPLSFEPLSFELRESVGREISRLCKKWAVVFCQCEASQLWRKALEPLVYKRTGVWIKPDAMPQYSGDRPGMGYESILFCHAPGRSTWNGGGRVGVFTYNKNSGGKHLHETQKPLPLMIDLVKLFTSPGDLVIDPFCGSGTTALACRKLGRNFICIDREQRFIDTAQMRYEELIAQGDFFGTGAQDKDSRGSAYNKPLTGSEAEQLSILEGSASSTQTAKEK